MKPLIQEGLRNESFKPYYFYHSYQKIHLERKCLWLECFWTSFLVKKASIESNTKFMVGLFSMRFSLLYYETNKPKNPYSFYSFSRLPRSARPAPSHLCLPHLPCLRCPHPLTPPAPHSLVVLQKCELLPSPVFLFSATPPPTYPYVRCVFIVEIWLWKPP